MPEKEILLKNKNDIIHYILLGLNKCCNYFKINKDIINSIFDEKYHALVKDYLNTFFELFIIHNKNCINKVNKNSPSLNNDLFELMIINTLYLYQLIAKNKNLEENNFYSLDILSRYSHIFH